ncbi:hypothetical protein DRP04_14140 [Archaeoglobales archaeon]|nr:MAG: hypothetical protein DRP04_14140 [Archaeoglobales archaeon]
MTVARTLTFVAAKSPCESEGIQEGRWEGKGGKFLYFTKKYRRAMLISYKFRIYWTRYKMK